MSLTGGKRKANKGLKAWVTFVKKVQKEEKLSYKDAIHRAKQRKDKGEKWMKGGNDGSLQEEEMGEETTPEEEMEEEMEMPNFSLEEEAYEGGRRRRRTMRRSRGSRKSRSRSSRKSRSRSSRRH